MAQSFTNNDGIRLVVPGTYVSPSVRANQGGLAAAGVVTLIGEANEGPAWSEESDLNDNGFAPDNIAAVINKYGSGRLVDAFRSIVAAANDPAIVGAVSLVKIVKVNPSLKASSDLARAGFGAFASISARRHGAPGNLIKYRSEISVAEEEAQTESFTYMPHYSASAVAFDLRLNGGALKSVSVPQLTQGEAFAALIEDLSAGYLAEGGRRCKPLTGHSGKTIAAVAQSSDTLLITLTAGTFNDTIGVVPAVGDTLVIAIPGEFGVTVTSALLGGSNQNRGAYFVQAVSNVGPNATITAKRINAPSGAPACVSASGTVGAGEDDLLSYRKVNVINATGMDRQATVGLSAVNFTSSNITGDWTIGTQEGVTMSMDKDWAAKPQVGDWVKFTSTFVGVLAGWYEVQSVSNNSFVLLRRTNGDLGATGTTLVAGPITQGSQPFTVYKKPVDGLGKSLEVIGDLSTIARNASSGAAASWASGSPLLVSAAEYRNAFTISRDTTSDTFLAGGEIVASFQCSQASATMVVGEEDVQFKVGSTVIFSASYAQYPTIQNLVDYVNSQSTFSAAVTAAKFAPVASNTLDRGTFGLSSAASNKRPARLKRDASEWQRIVSGSGLAEAALEGQSGLPEVVTPDVFLSAGAKAGSTTAQWIAAVDAVESVDTNFIVPLASKDASEDILEGETESSSTYTVDSINAYCKSHVIKMSGLKARKNRQAIVSRSGAYEDQKDAAGSLASPRVALAFQDVKVLGANGIEQFQPWMTAVIAAGMQAAAGYKGIVKKFANVSGLVKPEGDFNSSKPSELEDALLAGLLIMERVPTGGFRWVSDQNTYSVDNNFVYNSIQAVYIADLMILTLIQNFDRAIVGKSVAEISATAALAFLESEMFNFFRLRFIAPSDDGAPRGFKNASIKLQGGVMQVYVEVKLAGLIYFVPISFEISEVQQSAG